MIEAWWRSLKHQWLYLTIRGGCLLEATEGISHPKGGVGVGGCETNEMSVICNVCQQIADEKESGQGRDRTGDTRIFSPCAAQ